MTPETPPARENDPTHSSAARVRQALRPDGVGWIVIKSSLLEREILVVRDGRVAAPAELAFLTRYTLVELDGLLGGGATRQDLRDLDRVKRLAPDTTVTTFKTDRHPCVGGCGTEAGPGALWCPPCWQARQERGRIVLPFDPDRRARAIARTSARPCATCGATVFNFNARGDAACSSCFPPNEAER